LHRLGCLHLVSLEGGKLEHMERRRLRVGSAITPEEFEVLSDAQLERLVPKAYRHYYPGKEHCADGYFYLHDGTAWSFYKGGMLDD
jgi:hypothetical protein